MTWEVPAGGPAMRVWRPADEGFCSGGDVKVSLARGREVGVVAGLGFVDRVQPPGAALELAGPLAFGPADAVRLTAGLVRVALDADLEWFPELEWLNPARNVHGSDPAKGRAALADKRPANMTGGTW